MNSDNTACVQGTVSDCKAYIQGTNHCLECKDGFALLPAVNTKQYCYRVQSDNNCTKLRVFDTDGLNNSNYYCDSCTAPS